MVLDYKSFQPFALRRVLPSHTLYSTWKKLPLPPICLPPPPRLQDLEDSNSERNLKYRELRRREEEMQEFLRTYEQTKATETQAVASGQTEVVNTLETISRNLAHLRQLPS